MASATSYSRSSSSASGPERALSSTSPSRRRRPSSDSRFSSRSSTRRQYTGPISAVIGLQPPADTRRSRYRQNAGVGAGRDGGLRHRGRMGASRLLYARYAACFDHSSKAICAITVGSRKHHADQTVAVGVSRAFKQNIDRGTGEQDGLVVRQRQALILFDQEMIVRRGEVGDARFDRLLVLRFAHANCAACAQKLGEQTRLVRRKMNNDQNRQAIIRRQAGQEGRKRLEGTGRGADDDRFGSKCAHWPLRF